MKSALIVNPSFDTEIISFSVYVGADSAIVFVNNKNSSTSLLLLV